MIGVFLYLVFSFNPNKFSRVSAMWLVHIQAERLIGKKIITKSLRYLSVGDVRYRIKVPQKTFKIDLC
jgi:hypothetical protein